MDDLSEQLTTPAGKLIDEAAYRIQYLEHLLKETREYLRLDREVLNADEECDWHASLLIEIDEALEGGDINGH